MIWTYPMVINLNSNSELEFAQIRCFTNIFLAHLYKSTGRAIALPLALASAFTKMLKFYVKVFKTSYFLNPLMDLVDIWYNYTCWFKILLSPTHTPAHGLYVKVTYLEILC